MGTFHKVRGQIAVSVQIEVADGPSGALVGGFDYVDSISKR